MTNANSPALSCWLGNTVHSEDRIAPLLVERLAATLGTPRPRPGGALPALWHWAFFQPAEDEAALGSDGHPARGGFLPPAKGRIRMWAGGRLTFQRPLNVDSTTVRDSKIIDIQEKQGRSGALLFVTVRHDYSQNGETAFTEEQDIVYREPSAPRLSLDRPVPAADWSKTITPSPVLLFRYSAVTFNGHRIHYDWPYANSAEGYPGLVVHGPLIATLLFGAFTRARPDAYVQSFSFRSLRPLIAPKAFDVAGRVEHPGHAALWAANADGPAQEAELIFTENR
jgi:itaconyl-CoA hydratase/mesaconyl-C4 CoA hydratase